MSKNTLTVVTVTYNDLSGLKLTANSVELQVSQGFEWIVIDAGSNDGTQEFLRENKRIDKFISENDSGIYDGMRKGLGISSGAHVIF